MASSTSKCVSWASFLWKMRSKRMEQLALRLERLAWKYLRKGAISSTFFLEGFATSFYFSSPLPQIVFLLDFFTPSTCFLSGFSSETGLSFLAGAKNFPLPVLLRFSNTETFFFCFGRKAMDSRLISMVLTRLCSHWVARIFWTRLSPFGNWSVSVEVCYKYSISFFKSSIFELPLWCVGESREWGVWSLCKGSNSPRWYFRLNAFLWRVLRLSEAFREELLGRLCRLGLRSQRTWESWERRTE